MPIFQSTRPVRGATVDPDPYHMDGFISIHAPRAGRDKVALVEASAEGISIHAPRAGRDIAEPMEVTREKDFNPRAPCGARP